MMIFGRQWQEVERRIGHQSQVGGLKPYVLTEGRANGVRAVDFRTAAGLEFTVLLDRAMDISEARYKGMSLCWRSPAGDVAPAFYNPKGLEWLRTFSGGLLTTCGLTNVGPATSESDETGLHGRVSAVAAEQIEMQERWRGEESPFMQVKGLVREASLFGVDLEMQRTVRAPWTGAWVEVRDVITNVGSRPAPCMVLYHINLGFPLLDDDTKLFLPGTAMEPRDDAAREGMEEYAKMHGPVTGYQEKVYFHTLSAGGNGVVAVAVANRKLGLGVRLRYKPAELPYFTEWKMLGDREYVLGIEPGNCRPMGRDAERTAGRLVELQVGDSAHTGFVLEVVEGTVLEAMVREATSMPKG